MGRNVAPTKVERLEADRALLVRPQGRGQRRLARLGVDHDVVVGFELKVRTTVGTVVLVAVVCCRMIPCPDGDGDIGATYIPDLEARLKEAPAAIVCGVSF